MVEGYSCSGRTQPRIEKNTIALAEIFRNTNFVVFNFVKSFEIKLLFWTSGKTHSSALFGPSQLNFDETDFVQIWRRCLGNKDHLVMLCSLIIKTLVPNCLVLWLTSLPVSKKPYGGVLTPAVEYKTTKLTCDVCAANYYARRIIINHSFSLLDLHFCFHNRINMREWDGVHWWVSCTTLGFHTWLLIVIQTWMLKLNWSGHLVAHTAGLDLR